jgi:hypothetical protein
LPQRRNGDDSPQTIAMASATTQQPVEKDARARAFSGLALVFALSFLSLAGILLTIASLGGLGSWSRWQFVGLFGLIEAASGIANIIAPNVWRLPVVELTRESDKRTKLALSTILIPHWGGAARFLAGIALIALAGSQTGFGAESLGLLPLLPLLAIVMLALAALLARLGVAHPDFDVLQVTLKYAKRAREVDPLSISASVLQFLLSIATIPLVKTFEPGLLYQPEIGPSLPLLAAVSTAALLLVLVTVVVWSDRIDWQAPFWQQREAERNA